MDKILKKYLKNHDIDALGIGIIDFKNIKFETKTYLKKENEVEINDDIYFDLASLTKVLTNGVFYLDNINQMDERHRLLVEHRAGLPSWGLLSNKTWKEDLKQYEISESKTLYSDYSALRFMLEVSADLNKDMKTEVSKFYDKEVKFWTDLKTLDLTVQNGYEKGKPNFRCVHDPNARNIGRFTSHAGLFSTTRGLCKTLLNINNQLKLLKVIPEHISDNRFVLGWDRAEDPNLTTAGPGCSSKTFGHLGFTGTSIWIDPKLERGLVLLTNTTKRYWYYSRKDLKELRRTLGEKTWKHQDLSLESFFY